MIGLTLRQLRYFDALARIQHFGRAAQACAISQPALSMQIKELEEIFGAPLVERGGRQVRLTPLGALAAERVTEILQRIDGLDALVDKQRSALAGRLRIGVIPTIAPYLLPDVVRRIAATFPEAEVHARETVTPNLIDELREGRLDAAVVALPVSEPAFEEIALFDERFLLVRPKGDAAKPVPDATSLKQMRLLLLEEGHCFREQALSFCDLETNQVREALDASSLSTLVQMVGAGIGVTLIPEMALAVETRSADVAIAPFRAPEPKRTVGMIWRKTSPQAHEFSELGALVREAGLAVLAASASRD